MGLDHIKPFIESARIVIHQLIAIRPEEGLAEYKAVHSINRYIWIHIGLSGQLQGEIIFGLVREDALRLVSAMFGQQGMAEMDDMSHSAISELSNMISGNACIMLDHQGVKIDITTPLIIHSTDAGKFIPKNALTTPLRIAGIGILEIQVIIA